MAEPRELWVVRHGAVDAAGLCYGQHEVNTVHTAAIDAAQLLKLAPHLAGEPVHIATSPARRCAQLADALAAHLGSAPPSRDARLLELSFGAWEGQTWSDIEQRDAARFAAWMANWQHAAPPAGETAPQLANRLHAALDELRQGPALPRVLWITHAGPIRMLRHALLGKTLDAAFAEPVAHLQPERLPF